jgi:isoquinoline 1-oxidoreductase subunit alpha
MNLPKTDPVFAKHRRTVWTVILTPPTHAPSIRVNSLAEKKRSRPVITLKVNGKAVSVDVDPSTPLLWVLRDTLGLTGTKYGCGMALCGACTVHLNGDAIRSCVKRVADAVGKEITTIEGLSPNLTHPLQKAWIEVDVPQCGYCQSGQIMSAAVLLAENSNPTDTDIDDAMTGNICRCGTYQRIREAIHRAAEMKRSVK